MLSLVILYRKTRPRFEVVLADVWGGGGVAADYGKKKSFFIQSRTVFVLFCLNGRLPK